MKKCGDCYFWMKKSKCPREKGFQKGGPSCNDRACNQFNPEKKYLKGEEDKKMKTFNTLEELREALMSDEGAVFNSRERFRLKNYSLELYSFVHEKWICAYGRNHGFLWDIGYWTRYEKPKKIVKESFEGFVCDGAFEDLKVESDFSGLTFSREQSSFYKNKATITIEREVEDE